MTLFHISSYCKSSLPPSRQPLSSRDLSDIYLPIPHPPNPPAGTHTHVLNLHFTHSLSHPKQNIPSQQYIFSNPQLLPRKSLQFSKNPAHQMMKTPCNVEVIIGWSMAGVRVCACSFFFGCLVLFLPPFFLIVRRLEKYEVGSGIRHCIVVLREFCDCLDSNNTCVIFLSSWRQGWGGTNPSTLPTQPSASHPSVSPSQSASSNSLQPTNTCEPSA